MNTVIIGMQTYTETSCFRCCALAIFTRNLDTNRPSVIGMILSKALFAWLESPTDKFVALVALDHDVHPIAPSLPSHHVALRKVAGRQSAA